MHVEPLAGEELRRNKWEGMGWKWKGGAYRDGDGGGETEEADGGCDLGDGGDGYRVEGLCGVGWTVRGRRMGKGPREGETGIPRPAARGRFGRCGSVCSWWLWWWGQGWVREGVRGDVSAGCYEMSREAADGFVDTEGIPP